MNFLTQAIYNSIKLEAFKFPDEDLRTEYLFTVLKNADKEGWLMKQGEL